MTVGLNFILAKLVYKELYVLIGEKNYQLAMKVSNLKKMQIVTDSRGKINMRKTIKIRWYLKCALHHQNLLS